MQKVRLKEWSSSIIIKLKLLLATVMLFVFAASAFAAQGGIDAAPNEVKVQKVSFVNGIGIKIAGDLYFPVGFDATQTYAAVVVVPPAGGAKEQTAGLYARKLAERGFVAIAFDASFQGESGGEPRYKEDPIARVEDVRGAVDYLVGRPYVDENGIGVLGICAGGGYAVSAAMTERRIKAVGVSVPVNAGREMRAGGRESTIAALEAVAKQRTAEARGAKPMVVPWILDEYKTSSDVDLRGAYQYYRTPRGQTPNWKNKMRYTSMDAVMAFDAFYLVDMLLTQPLQVIVGSQQGAYGSNKDGHELYNRAASIHKDLMVMEGASHFDLYDNPAYVNVAVKKLAEFYQTYLR